MFAHIRNINYLIENLSDWSIFENAMSSSLKRPSDLDGYYESYGNTLFLEEKIHGTPVPIGQSITFGNWHLAPDKAVMVLWYIKTYVYDENRNHVIDQHGLNEFTKEYTQVAIYVHGQEPYVRSINNIDKPRKFVGNWEIWSKKNPYLTKQQMITRVTNGVTVADAKQLFSGIRREWEFDD